MTPKTPHMFYCSFIESVLTYCLVCWLGTLSVKNRGKLDSIVNRGSEVVRVRQTGLNQLYEMKAKRKGIDIMSDLSHILSQNYNMLPSGRRLRVFRAKKPDIGQFYPPSITLINKT